MKTALFVSVLVMSSSLLLASADGPDFLQTRGLKTGELLCLHRDHNLSSPAIAAIPAPVKCLKNLGYYPQTGDAPPPPGTIVWVGIEYNGTKGWALAEWLGEADGCNAEKAKKK